MDGKIKCFDGRTDRQSNIELLRIIAMMMIIAYHFVVHGANNLIPQTSSIARVWINLFSMCGKMGVNLFVLIAGFMGIHREFRFEKLFRIEGVQLFYSISLMILFIIVGYPFDLKLIIASILPTIFGDYWFISSYIILYLLTPYINRFLKGLDKNKYRHLIGLGMVLWSIIPFFTIQISVGMFFTQFLWMIITYSVGAYIGLYYDDFNNCITIRKHSINWINVFWVCMIIDIVYIVSTVLAGRYSLTFVYYSIYASYGSNSPIIILGAIGLFVFITHVNIGSIKWINSLAASALPVYLLHENKWFSSWLWETVISFDHMMSMPLLMVYSFFIIIAIYLFGHIVNQVRILLCRLLKRPLEAIERMAERGFDAIVRFTEIIP